MYIILKCQNSFPQPMSSMKALVYLSITCATDTCTCRFLANVTYIAGMWIVGLKYTQFTGTYNIPVTLFKNSLKRSLIENYLCYESDLYSWCPVSQPVDVSSEPAACVLVHGYPQFSFSFSVSLRTQNCLPSLTFFIFQNLIWP